MMPMRPATLAEQARRFVPRLDPHVRDETLGLPAGEVLSDYGVNPPLASEIILGYGRDGSLFPTLPKTFLGDPLDAVEPLVEDVVRARREIRFLPEPQTVADISLCVPVISTDRLDLNARELCVHWMDKPAIPHRAVLGRRHF